MLEMGSSGLMSGEGKRTVANWQRYRALPRLYDPIRSRLSVIVFAVNDPSAGYRIATSVERCHSVNSSLSSQRA
jgi:hypothetical protein